MRLYQNTIGLFIIWFLVLILIFYFGFSVFPHEKNTSRVFFNNLANWDGGHFNRIAKFGYQEKFQYAFFPAYPLAIRFLNSIMQNYIVSGVTISIFSAFFSVQILYKLILDEFGKKRAKEAIQYFLFFPTSFFLLTAYSEAFFLLLALLSFFFFKKKFFLLSTLFIIAASLTRVVGLAVMGAILVEVFLKGVNRKNWIILFSPIGFLFYCGYLFQMTNNPFYFIEAEAHWQRFVSLPWSGFWTSIENLSRPGFINQYFYVFWDLVFAVFGLGIVLRGIRFLPRLYLSYSLISLLIPLLTPSLLSIPRFLLPIFPIFILISKVNNQYFKFLYLMLSLMLLSAFAILYINGYWVS